MLFNPLFRPFLNRYFACLCMILAVATESKSFAAAQKGLEHIKAKKQLNMCSESGFIPFEMKTISNKWLGFDPDLMRAFAEYLNVKLNIIDTNWVGIIPSLISGKCDVIASSMAKNAEREKIVTFSVPVYRNELLIAVKNTPENKQKIKAYTDLNSPSYRIAVKTGSSTDLFLKNSKIFSRAKILSFDGDIDTISAVLQNKADAFIYDKAYVKAALLEYPGKLFILPQGLHGEDISVAFRKQDVSLVNSFNEFFAKYKASGKYDKLADHYFNSLDWKPLLAK